MAPVKLLNLLALSTLAIFSSSFAPLQAFAVAPGHDFQNVARGHDAIAKRKRAPTPQRRCKPRTPPTASATSSVHETTSKAAPTSSKPAETPKPSPTSSKSTSSSGSKSTSDSGDQGSSSGSKGATTGGATTSTGSGKMGIAWPNGPDQNGNLHFYKTAATKYIYTWSPYYPSNAKSLGFEPLPMLWGPKQIGDWQKQVLNGPNSYANYALGFNEPNQSGQSDLDPGYAAQLWKQYIQPLKARGYKFISPACTNAPTGKTWMKSFLAACDGCTIDGFAIHYYDTSAQGLIDYVEDYHKTFNAPIWITEAACQNFGGGAQCTKDQVSSFMATIQKYVEGSDHVAAFFPFGVMQDMYNVNPLNQLMASNGQPTNLGWQFLSS